MSKSRAAARAACRAKSVGYPCHCGSSVATRGAIECRPCRGCGLVMHSVYDEEAHQNHKGAGGRG